MAKGEFPLDLSSGPLIARNDKVVKSLVVLRVTQADSSDHPDAWWMFEGGVSFAVVTAGLVVVATLDRCTA